MARTQGRRQAGRARAPAPARARRGSGSGVGSGSGAGCGAGDSAPSPHPPTSSDLAAAGLALAGVGLARVGFLRLAAGDHGGDDLVVGQLLQRPVQQRQEQIGANPGEPIGVPGPADGAGQLEDPFTRGGGLGRREPGGADGGGAIAVEVAGHGPLAHRVLVAPPQHVGIQQRQTPLPQPVAQLAGGPARRRRQQLRAQPSDLRRGQLPGVLHEQPRLRPVDPARAQLPPPPRAAAPAAAPPGRARRTPHPW